MDIVKSIREALPITGRTIVEVTAEDWDEVIAAYPNHSGRLSHIYLHLDDGSTAGFVIGEYPIAFSYDGYPDDHPLRQSSEEDQSGKIG